MTDLNILVRGQSNAIIFYEYWGWLGSGTLEAEVERLLGFDGRTNDVRLLYERYDDSGATAYGATALIGDWLSPAPGGWSSGPWAPASREEGLLTYIDRLSPQTLDDPTAVFWLHSEYDSRRSDLTAAEWTSAVRADMAMVRGALGQPDAPHHFVDALPYGGGTDTGTQAIRLGMEQLAADPAAHATLAARTNDTDIAGDGWYGSSHIDAGDAEQIARRAARSIAEDWAEHALPGSPVALAGGNLADDGPQAIAALRTGPRTVEVDVRHDQAGGFASLDPDAAAGTGWQVRAAGADGGWTHASSAAVVDGDTLRIGFDADLPAEGSLFYGWGYGRLWGADGSGRGNAVYDDQGLPVWVSAEGLAMTAVAAALVGTSGRDRLVGTADAEPVSGGSGDDTLLGVAGNDTLDGGAGADRLLGGPGEDLYRVDAAADIVAERPGEGSADLVVAAEGLSWVLPSQVEQLRLDGTARADGTGNNFVNRLEGSEGANRILGLGQRDTLAGRGADDTLEGGAGQDSIDGGSGTDLLMGGDAADTLHGGPEADRFRLDAPGRGVDVIADFAPGAEQVEISASLLAGGLQPGMSMGAPGRFAANLTGRSDAPAGTGQLIHETDAARLWWDADGVGGTASVPMAVLQGRPELSAADIVVIA